MPLDVVQFGIRHFKFVLLMVHMKKIKETREMESSGKEEMVPVGKGGKIKFEERKQGKQTEIFGRNIFCFCIPAMHRMSFSSYPGYLISLDDFYTMDRCECFAALFSFI